MQLKMPFPDTAEPEPVITPGPICPPSTAWDNLDEAARIAALGVLARLIARMVAAAPDKEAGHD